MLRQLSPHVKIIESEEDGQRGLRFEFHLSEADYERIQLMATKNGETVATVLEDLAHEVLVVRRGR